MTRDGEEGSGMTTVVGHGGGSDPVGRSHAVRPVLDWGPCPYVEEVPQEWRAYAGSYVFGVVQRRGRFQAKGGGDDDNFATLEEAQVAEEASAMRMLKG